MRMLNFLRDREKYPYKGELTKYINGGKIVGDAYDQSENPLVFSRQPLPIRNHQDDAQPQRREEGVQQEMARQDGASIDLIYLAHGIAAAAGSKRGVCR